MKVAFSLISLLSLGFIFAQEEICDDQERQEYYYQECPCCVRYYMYRRYTPEQERTFRDLTESRWPSKRRDSIIDEVRW
jgi:hypothetical protein